MKKSLPNRLLVLMRVASPALTAFIFKWRAEVKPDVIYAAERLFTTSFDRSKGPSRDRG